MIAAILVGLRSIRSSPLLRGLAIAAGLVAAFGWWTWHVRSEAAAAARAEVIAEYRAATEAEAERRRAVIAQARAEAEETAARAAQTERRNASLIAEINRLSAARDRAPCLDPDGVRRLNQVGRSPGR